MKPTSRNVVRVFRKATEDELDEARRWYDGARFVARVVSELARRPFRHGAGVIAALSPMNRWEDNASNAVAMARDVNAKVRTTGINRWKAVRILAGEDPEDVLSGRKVVAFYRAIADPEHAETIAIDRHIWRACLGSWINGREAAPKGLDYDLAELAVLRASWKLGESPLMVAAALWVVMRREHRSQRSL